MSHLDTSPSDAFKAKVTSFRLEGFPEAMTNAFLKTSNILNCVVSTRTPGVAGTGLIERRYDLKGFFIKAKSCDWGPMAGFVCMLPWLNKSGLEAAGGNLQYHLKYLLARSALKINVPPDLLRAQILEARLKAQGYPLSQAQKDAPATPDEIQAATALLAAAIGQPFVPLLIPRSRIAEVCALTKLNAHDPYGGGLRLPAGVADQLAGAMTRIVGIAANKDGSVVMDFALQPVANQPVPGPTDRNGAADPIWEILSGNIWVRTALRTPYIRIGPTDNLFDSALLQTAIAKARDDAGNKIYISEILAGEFQPHAGNPPVPFGQATTLGAGELAQVKALYAAFSTDFTDATRQGLISDQFRPVFGVCNPYPPYPVDPDPQGARHNEWRNTVSGDFDLFAIWPVANARSSLFAPGGTPQDMLPRISEGAAVPRAANPAAAATPDRGSLLFGPVADKDFTLRLVANPNVLIEFIRSELRESPIYGNVNDAVLLTAQTLNSMFYYYYAKVIDDFSQPAPNVAFHSDEGGRPFVKGVGYDAAFFWPDHLAQGEDRLDLVTNDAGLMAMILRAKAACYVPIQAVWLASLMLNCELDPEKAARDGVASYDDIAALVLGPPQGGRYQDYQTAGFAALALAFSVALGAFSSRDGEFANLLPDDFIAKAARITLATAP